MPILEHAVASAAPAASYKSRLHSILWKRMSRKKASPRPSERCGRGDLHPAPPHSSPHS